MFPWKLWSVFNVSLETIKVLLGQRYTVLFKEGGTLCSFNNIVDRAVSKQGTALDTILYFQVYCACEKSRLKQIVLFADYD